MRKLVTTTNTATEVTTSLTAGQLSIAIPATIDMESVAFRLSTDGTPDRSGRREDALQATQTAIDTRGVVLNVFPNPATDMVNLEFADNEASGPVTVQLFDATGRKVKDVFSGTLEKQRTQRFAISMSEYPSQSYFILITSGSKRLLRQVVKQ